MRHAPEMPLPSRPYLPGTGAPRPELARPPAAPLTLASWREHRGLAFGFDLFERGFFWEAHEAWEDAWQLTGEGPARELLRGLIQLAASRVQQRLGSDGADRLAERAADHLRAAERSRPIVCGVWIDEVLTTGALRWRRRTRDLFGARTSLVVQPLECVFERGDGAIVMRTPGYRGYYGGRVCYDDILDPETARAAATDALAGDGPGYLNLIWEVEEPGPVGLEVREGDQLDHLIVLISRALAIEPRRPPGIEVRALASDADWAAIADFTGRLAVADWGPDARAFNQWRYRHFRATVELWGGDFFGAFDGDELVGSLGIVDTGQLLRYQDVQVAVSHRRRGIARYLCAHAFRAAGAGSEKPAVIVADAGSIAERLYRQLGFVHTSTQHELRWMYEG